MNQVSLRVLLLADSRSVHTERFTSALQQQGCHVLLASLEHGHVDHIPLTSNRTARAPQYVYAVPKVRKLVADFQPDIIDAHFASGYGFLVSLLGNQYHIPRMVHVLGSDILVAPHQSWLHRYKVVRALKKADSVVADSQYLMEKAAELCPVAEQAVIPWGIERTYLSYHKTDYTLQKPLKIIVPRSHEPIYDNISIVRSLVPLIRDNQIEITFPSTGSLFSSFQQESKNLAGNAIRYYQPMNRDAFIQFMASFDIYLSASLSDSSPVSLIEAMALGLIPVVADIPGVKEWLGPENGYLFSNNDSNQLVEIISRIVTDNDSHTSVKKLNLEKVKQSGIFEENMKKQLALMKTLVETHNV